MEPCVCMTPPRSPHWMFQLELKGMRIEDGTDSGADSDFLMELMEINEALDEAQSPEEAREIGRDTKGRTSPVWALCGHRVV